MQRSRFAAILVVVTLMVAACSSSGSTASSGGSVPANAVTLSTTTGLRPLMDKLVLAFRQAQPGVPVTVRNDDSRAAVQATLRDRTALVVAAPSPLLAGKDVKPLGRTLAVIAVPAANPGRVSGPEAFSTGTSLRTQICGGSSYIPVFLLYVLRLSNVQTNAATIANDAQCPSRAMLSLVAGQLDAALMFRNMVTVPPGVRLVDIPDDRNLVFRFGLTKLASTPVSDTFVDFLGSSAAKEILTANGYLP